MSSEQCHRTRVRDVGWFVLYLVLSAGFLLAGPKEERLASFRLAFALPRVGVSPGETSSLGSLG